MSKVVDLVHRRELKRFLTRVEAAAADFPLYILIDHEVVRCTDFHAWAEFKVDFEVNCRVGNTQVGQRWVSTVFLGTNCRHFGDGPPIVFETMIFGPGQSDVVDRYETWDEAAAGHEKVVASLTDAA